MLLAPRLLLDTYVLQALLKYNYSTLHGHTARKYCMHRTLAYILKRNTYHQTLVALMKKPKVLLLYWADYSKKPDQSE